MPRRILAFLFALLAVAGSVQLARAFGPSPVANYEIPFPGDNFMPLYNMDVQDQLAAASPGWRTFTGAVAPNWRAFLWNEATQVPDFAAGAPIPVLTVGTHDATDMAARSSEFLATIRNLLRVDSADLRFETLADMGDRAYVHFQQYYQGLPVFYGVLSLHYDRGGVNAISAGIFPDLAIDTSPTLT
jgi:hypothetical protein